jgi:hypothetical protein
MAVLGMVVGIVRPPRDGAYRMRSGPSHSPYVGWMKWHHYTGLVFGVLSVTWAFSGRHVTRPPVHLSPHRSADRRPENGGCEDATRISSR